MSLPAEEPEVSRREAIVGAGVALALVFLPRLAGAQMTRGTELGALALRLEGALNRRTALAPDWPSQRPMWAALLRVPLVPPQVAGQLLALESALRPAAMQDSWPGMRDAWRGRIPGSPGAAVVAQLLLEIEAAVRPDSLLPAWPRRRAPWIARLREIAAGAQPR